MKKLLVPAAVLAMIFSSVVLVSCGDDDKKDDPAPQNSAPTVTITKPLSNKTYVLSKDTKDSLMEYSATANDADGQVVSVEFFVNGTSIGIDTESPFVKEYKFKGDEGYNLKVIATDNLGAKTEATSMAIPVILF